MNNDQLNALVIRYQKTRDNWIFKEIRDKVSSTWARRCVPDSRRAKVSKEDVLAMYDDTLWKVADRYDPERGNFTHMLATAIANGLKDLARKGSKRRWLEMYAENEKQESLILEFPDESTKRLEKTKEQRELLLHLTAELDDLTLNCCNLFMAYDSFYAVGKRLGVCHKRVKRKIEGVSHRFDGNHFGDYRDYLAV